MSSSEDECLYISAAKQFSKLCAENSDNDSDDNINKSGTKISKTNFAHSINNKQKNISVGSDVSNDLEDVSLAERLINSRSKTLEYEHSFSLIDTQKQQDLTYLENNANYLENIPLASNLNEKNPSEKIIEELNNSDFSNVKKIKVSNKKKVGKRKSSINNDGIILASSIVPSTTEKRNHNNTPRRKNIRIASESKAISNFSPRITRRTLTGVSSRRTPVRGKTSHRGTGGRARRSLSRTEKICAAIAEVDLTNLLSSPKRSRTRQQTSNRRSRNSIRQQKPIETISLDNDDNELNSTSGETFGYTCRTPVRGKTSHRGTGGRARRSLSRTEEICAALAVVDLTNLLSSPKRSRTRQQTSNRRSRNSISQQKPIETISLDNDDDELNSISDETFDANIEYKIKVWWQFREFHTFYIRKYQKLQTIFEFYAERENISINKLMFLVNDKIIKPDDTPHSLKLNMMQLIEGGFVQEEITSVVQNKTDKNVISLKVQLRDRKRPLLVELYKTEPMSVLMGKCSEECGKDIDLLKFYFDGDKINPSDTPEMLDFEGGECIDVFVK